MFPYSLNVLGFDVWMGNSRGVTPWGKAHETLDPASKDFWAFSWDSMAQYDIPANIEFVLKFTRQTSLSYVCHSQVRKIYQTIMCMYYIYIYMYACLLHIFIYIICFNNKGMHKCHSRANRRSCGRVSN